jgi:hypothetical protein
MTDSLPARQPIERSEPLKVTGRLKHALELMVWSGLARDAAAKEAGLKPHSLYCAFRKSHVLAHYRNECEALRVSGRAKRLHRLDELAAQDENKNAAPASLLAASGTPPTRQGRRGARAR